MLIGSKILKIRKDNNLSQEEFAKIFKVTRQTVSSWENNKNYPDLETLVKIAEQYNVSLDYLIKDDKELAKKYKKKKINIPLVVITSLICIFIIGWLILKVLFVACIYSQNADLSGLTFYREKNISRKKMNDDDYIKFENINIPKSIEESAIKKYDNEYNTLNYSYGNKIISIYKNEINPEIKYYMVHYDYHLKYGDDLTSKLLKNFDYNKVIESNDIKNDDDFINYVLSLDYNINIFTSFKDLKEVLFFTSIYHSDYELSDFFNSSSISSPKEKIFDENNIHYATISSWRRFNFININRYIFIDFFKDNQIYTICISDTDSDRFSDDFINELISSTYID